MASWRIVDYAGRFGVSGWFNGAIGFGEKRVRANHIQAGEQHVRGLRAHLGLLKIRETKFRKARLAPLQGECAILGNME